MISGPCPYSATWATNGHLAPQPIFNIGHLNLNHRLQCGRLPYGNLFTCTKKPGSIQPEVGGFFDGDWVRDGLDRALSDLHNEDLPLDLDVHQLAEVDLVLDLCVRSSQLDGVCGSHHGYLRGAKHQN